MLKTTGLSESAVATLQFEVHGPKYPVREIDLPGFRELVAAGIMEEIPRDNSLPDFRFTEEGMAHRKEILCSETERIEAERFAPPDREISEAARALLRTCITGRMPDGDESNRPAYRELVKARIMMPLGSFSKGNECVFRFTYWGYKQRFELAGMEPVTA